MTGVDVAFVDDAYARINCYDIGDWLTELYLQLGLSLPSTPEPWEQHSSPRSSGLVITIYRQPNIAPPPAMPRDALVLAKVEGDGSAPAPRGLDAARETPATAKAKLSANVEGGSRDLIAAGDTRITYFMPDFKVVELRFNRDLVGFDRFVFVGLGTTSAYRP